jgi:MurNAc alpha-1-phosphate uridylyltransferase
MTTAPKTAMVLAAGLGTRMRPLTDDRPKALVEVGGKALIDHMLDRLVEAGVERAVVNVHALRRPARSPPGARRPRAPAHRHLRRAHAQALETGGGIKHALPLLGEDPVWVANIDSVWIENGAPALDAVAAAWDPDRMDCLPAAGLDRRLAGLPRQRRRVPR